MKLSVIIPVYNPGTNFVSKLTEILTLSGSDTEIILVVDGINLNKALLDELSCMPVRLEQLPKNYGQELATLWGLSVATHDLLLTIDEDFPVNIDGVLGVCEDLSRADSNGATHVRYVVENRLGRGLCRGFMSSMLHYLIDDTVRTSSTRIIKLDRARRVSEPLEFLNVKGWLKSMKAHDSAMLAAYNPGDRESNYDFGSLIAVAIARIQPQSDRLISLALVVFIGCIVGVLGVGFYILFDFFIFGREVPGYASQMLLSVFGFSLVIILQLVIFLLLYTDVRARFDGLSLGNRRREHSKHARE